MGLSHSQSSPPSPQTSACPPARRQCAVPPISAANQDAPINKDSKSSNPRSLRQHTPAEPIPPCLCFVLRNRPFHHTNLQVSPRSRSSFKVLILGPHSRGRIYLPSPSRTSPAFAFTSPRLPHLPWVVQLQQWPARYLRFSQWTPLQCRPIGGMG